MIPEGNAWDINNVKIPERNYTPKGGLEGCIITMTTHRDDQETNQGKNDMKRN